MATLYDGNPVFAPAAGATALASDQVTLQAKLILGLEARYTSVSLAAAQVGDAAGWGLTWTQGATPDLYWSVTNTSSSELILPIYVRDNERITQTDVWLSTTAGSPTAGSIVLYEQTLNGGGSVNVISDFGCTGNFWDTDGVVTRYSDAGLTKDISSNSFYFIGVVGATGGMAGLTSTLYGFSYISMFHKGT